MASAPGAFWEMVAEGGDWTLLGSVTLGLTVSWDTGTVGVAPGGVVRREGGVWGIILFSSFPFIALMVTGMDRHLEKPATHDGEELVHTLPMQLSLFSCLIRYYCINEYPFGEILLEHSNIPL